MSEPDPLTIEQRRLLAMLDRYRDRYPQEQSTVERISQLVRTRGDCWFRTCRPGHLTGAAWVVSHDGRQCAVVHHRKLDRWLQPGGHADGETNLAQVALREAQEELGIADLRLMEPAEPLDIDVHWIPPRYGQNGELVDDGHEHHDLRFLVVAPPGAVAVASHESHAAVWIDLDQVESLTSEDSVLRLRTKSLWRTRDQGQCGL